MQYYYILCSNTYYYGDMESGGLNPGDMDDVSV